MRTLTLLMGFLCLSCAFSFTQDLTITQYDLGDDLDDTQLMQFTETTDGQVYFLYFYFDSGVRKHRLQVFDGSQWTPIERPCERCIDHLHGGADGNLYGATEAGIQSYDVATDTWSVYLKVPSVYLLNNPDGTLAYLSADGIFDYDGTTSTPRNNAEVPVLTNVNDAVQAPNGDVYVKNGGSLYRHDADGWETLTDITSPLYLDVAPDGRVYVADNFGRVHTYDEQQTYEDDVLDGVFSFTTTFSEFAINQDGVFWFATKGSNPGLARYEPGAAPVVIPTGDIVPGGIILNKVFISSTNLVFAAADFQTYITTIDDGTVTSVLQAPAPDLEFSLHPNPASDNTTLAWSDLPEGTGTLEVYDTAGRLQQRKIMEVTNGSTHYPVDVSEWLAGSYWVVLRVGDHYGRQPLIVR